MNRHVLTLTAVLLPLTAAGCNQAGPATAEILMHQPILTEGGIRLQRSGLDSVAGMDIYRDKTRIHVLTAGKIGGTMTLTYTYSTDSGESWSPPRRLPLSESQRPFLAGHGSHAPQIAADGDRIAVMWAIHGNGWGGAGPLLTAYSTDRGQSWIIRPGPATASVAQDFHDLIFDGDGMLHAAWLDNRNSEQGLYHAASRDVGSHWSVNHVLDERTCECCRNSFAVDDDGLLYVLYRDIEPRDMALMRSTDSSRQAWQRQATVGRFDWRFDGCPHTGGGLVTAGGWLYASVWTGADKRTGAYLLQSTDHGKTWSRAHALGDATARHTDVAVAGDDRVAVVWDASQNGAVAIYLATATSDPFGVHEPVRLRASAMVLGRPRVVATPTGVNTFWRERLADGRVGWASLPLELAD